LWIANNKCADVDSKKMISAFCGPMWVRMLQITSFAPACTPLNWLGQIRHSKAPPWSPVREILGKKKKKKKKKIGRQIKTEITIN